MKEPSNKRMVREQPVPVIKPLQVSTLDMDNLAVFYQHNLMTLMYLLNKEGAVLSTSFLNTSILNHATNSSVSDQQPYYDKLIKYMQTKTKYKHKTKFNIKKGLLSHQQSQQKLYRPRRQQSIINNQQPIQQFQSPPISSDDDLSQQECTNIDYSTWKRRKGYNENDKIFICFGRHHQIRESLLQRGWKENSDYHSIYYDYIWAQKLCHVNVVAIQQQQYLNHFGRTNCLAIKSQLAMNLTGLIHSHGCDIYAFFPLSYDLYDNRQLDDFLLHFKYQKARSILLEYSESQSQSESESEGFGCENIIYQLKVCLSAYLIEQLNTHLSDTLSSITNDRFQVINNLQYMVLTEHTVITDEQMREYQQQISEYLLTVYPYQEDQSDRDWLEWVVRKIIDKHETVYSQLQVSGTNNIWMLKPSEMSRGRGIRCYKDLEKIVDQIQNSNCQYVVQKYLERPLIIHNKKFDIRLWALVRCVSPLQIWIYQDYYLRFSALDYSLSDISNRFIHLTNNAVQRQRNEESVISENMWSREEFIDYLGKSMCIESIEREKELSQRMYEIVYLSWKSVQDQVENRRKSFELFGYDFMVDMQLRPWLLEVNSSPSLDYSTKVTEHLVKQMLEDTVKLTVDYGMTNKFNRDQIKTGRYICITKQGYLAKQSFYHRQ